MILQHVRVELRQTDPQKEVDALQSVQFSEHLKETRSRFLPTAVIRHASIRFNEGTPSAAESDSEKCAVSCRVESVVQGDTSIRKGLSAERIRTV